MALLCALSFVGRAFAGGFSFGEPLEGRVSTLDANSTAFLGCRSRAHSQSRFCCGHLVGRTSIFLATSLIIVQHRFSVTSLPFRLVVPPDCFCSPQYDSMKMVAVSLGSSCVGLPSNRSAAQPARLEAQAQRGTSNKLGLAALERRARAKQSSTSRKPQLPPQCAL